MAFFNRFYLLSRLVIYFTLFNLSGQVLGVNESRAEDLQPNSAPTFPLVQDWNMNFLIDCSHKMDIDKGTGDSCIRLTQLSLGGRFKISERMEGSLALSPFYNPSADHRRLSYEDFSMEEGAGSLRPLMDYRLAWQAKPNLTFALEQTEGSVSYPSLSGLSMASPFSNSAWYQTALTVAYTLPALKDSQVKFFLGNGEGENGENLDVQQYFGVNLQAGIIDGLQARAGIALDGNRYGSQATESSLLENANCLTVPAAASQGGYESQRMGAALVLDGSMPSARGLKGALAYQRVSLSDLNKEKTMALPGAACDRLDPDRFFVEDAAQAAANVVVQEIYGLNLSYRILDQYFAAIDYQTRKIHSEHVAAFDICDAHASVGSCTNPNAVKVLEQGSFTFGLGMDVEDGFQLILDYSNLQYQKSYRQFYYLGKNGAPAKNLEWLNFRVAAQI